MKTGASFRESKIRSLANHTNEAKSWSRLGFDVNFRICVTKRAFERLCGYTEHVVCVSAGKFFKPLQNQTLSSVLQSWDWQASTSCLPPCNDFT